MLILLIVNTEFQDHSAHRNDLSENMFLEENYTWLIIDQNENVKIMPHDHTRYLPKDLDLPPCLSSLHYIWAVFWKMRITHI